MATEHQDRGARTRLPKDLPTDLSRRLADAGSKQTLALDATLFSAGAEPAFLYLITSGRIALIGESAGDSAVIEVFGEGEILLMPAVVLDLPYLLTARALVETQVVAVPAAAFRAMLDHDAALARTVIDQLARHWRVLIRQIKDLKLRAGAQRLASYLLALDRTRSGRIYLPMERRMLAGRLGMSPEHLSRAFSRLREQGVATTGRAVTIADDAALRRFCDFDPML